MIDKKARGVIILSGQRGDTQEVEEAALLRL